MNDDPLYFRQQPRRSHRLRTPAPGEFAHAWQTLGGHEASRRRVLVWRVPKDNPMRDAVPGGMMRIPFIMRQDEAIADDETTLATLLAHMMKDAAAAPSVGGFAITGEPEFPGWASV